MDCSVNGSFYPLEGVFNEETLLNSLQKRDSEDQSVENVIYDDTPFKEYPGLPDELQLHPEPLDTIFKGRLVFFNQPVDMVEVAETYQTILPKETIDSILKDLSQQLLLEKIAKSESLTKARLETQKKIALKDAIKILLNFFDTEKKIALLALELEKNSSFNFKEQYKFTKPLVFIQKKNELAGFAFNLPESTTMTRHLFAEFFHDIVKNNLVDIEVFKKKQDFLVTFLESTQDKEIISIINDIFQKVQYDKLIEFGINLFGLIDKTGEIFLLECRRFSIIPKIFKMFPFLGLFFNIHFQRDTAIDIADRYQEKWPNFFELKFSLRDRVNWKYSQLARGLVEDALNKNYFFLRQNGILNELKERYGQGADPLFEPYFAKPKSREVVPLDLSDWHKEIDKKKKKGKKSTRVTNNSPVNNQKEGGSSCAKDEGSSQVLNSPSSSEEEEDLIFEGSPFLSSIAKNKGLNIKKNEAKKTSSSIPEIEIGEKLRKLAYTLFQYEETVSRYLAINPSKHLEQIRTFRHKGECILQNASPEELLDAWLRHSFPPIEVILKDEELRSRFVLEQIVDNNKSFVMVVSVQYKNYEPRYGRVRIGFHKQKPDVIVHRYFNPGNESAKMVPYLKKMLEKEDETDTVPLSNEGREGVFDSLNFSVEGEGVFQTIKVVDKTRNITLTACPIPSWFR